MSSFRLQRCSLLWLILLLLFIVLLMIFLLPLLFFLFLLFFSFVSFLSFSSLSSFFLSSFSFSSSSSSSFPSTFFSSPTFSSTSSSLCNFVWRPFFFHSVLLTLSDYLPFLVIPARHNSLFSLENACWLLTVLLRPSFFSFLSFLVPVLRIAFRHPSFLSPDRCTTVGRTLL